MILFFPKQPIISKGLSWMSNKIGIRFLPFFMGKFPSQSFCNTKENQKTFILSMTFFFRSRTKKQFQTVILTLSPRFPRIPLCVVIFKTQRKEHCWCYGDIVSEISTRGMAITSLTFTNLDQKFPPYGTIFWKLLDLKTARFCQNRSAIWF